MSICCCKGAAAVIVASVPLALEQTVALCLLLRQYGQNLVARDGRFDHIAPQIRCIACPRCVYTVLCFLSVSVPFVSVENDVCCTLQSGGVGLESQYCAMVHAKATACIRVWQNRRKHHLDEPNPKEAEEKTRGYRPVHIKPLSLICHHNYMLFGTCILLPSIITRVYVRTSLSFSLLSLQRHTTNVSLPAPCSLGHMHCLLNCNGAWPHFIPSAKSPGMHFVI